MGHRSQGIHLVVLHIRGIMASHHSLGRKEAATNVVEGPNSIALLMNCGLLAVISEEADSTSMAGSFPFLKSDHSFQALYSF
jgi:hypothetical protein